jgi:hypothetical protein
LTKSQIIEERTFMEKDEVLVDMSARGSIV